VNCTSEVRQIPGLKPRRPKGLQRPTKTVPGLGTLEYAREERCHSWQLTHHFVPSRATLIDEILGETEEPAEAVGVFSKLVQNERGIRERAVRARYFEFISPEFRNPPFDDIIDHLDNWVAPYRITRWASGWWMHYDCTDGPNRQLLGAPQIHVKVDPDWSISDVHYFTAGIGEDLELSAYRQRVPPEGFVIDSIVDQFIGTRSVKPTPELASLLAECIDQADDLLHKSPGGAAEAFYRYVLSLLCKLRDTRFTETS